MTSNTISTFESPPYKTNRYLWGLRFIQILFAIIIVGITGSNISDWHGLGCSSPPKLSFNFAIGFISLLFILYFIFSTGPHIKLHWWHFLIQLALDALFVILWIVAAALASYDCDSICAACSGPGAEVDIGYGFWVQVNDLFCSCVFEDDFTSKRRDAPSNIFRRGGGRSVSSGGSSTGRNLGKTLEKGISVAAKRGLDATMIILFLISLGALLSLKYSSRGNEAAGIRSAEQVNEHVDNAFKTDQPVAAVNVDQVV